METKPRDVQVTSLGEATLALRSRTWDRLKFESEYARQRGTTANAYLIQARDTALIDPPGESFTDHFLDELEQHQALPRLGYIILSHINQNRLTTLKRLLELAPYATVVCSKPAAISLRSELAQGETWTLRDEEAEDLGIDYDNRTLKIKVVRDDDRLDLGNGHRLQFRFVPTPRHPDAIATYDLATQILFSDKLYGAHICSERVFDSDWRQLEDDRRYFFDCIHAAQAVPVATALNKLEVFSPHLIAPAHGPIVRHSLSRVQVAYRDWCAEQQAQELQVALLFTSAYGNTGLMASTIASELQQQGIAVQSVNCEFTPSDEITRIVNGCDGFLLGTPTLAGHAPVQMQTALGMILTSVPSTKVAGVFGSYGWSGEAVDELAQKLRNAGHPLAFEPLRIKFTPDDTDLAACRTAAQAFGQLLRRSQKQRSPRPAVVHADRTEQAVNRVLGSACIISVKLGERHQGFLSSWVSQASFAPPGLTLAIPKDYAGMLLDTSAFVLNILQEDSKTLQRAFQTAPQPGVDRFAEWPTQVAENGCLVLDDALAYLECRATSSIEAGDHMLIYAQIEGGKVQALEAMTAVR